MATYLYFILTGFLKTAKNRGHTSKGILVNYPGAPWVATYLHFILTEFSKTVKSSGHTSTGILVNYPEVFLSGYRKKSQPQAFRSITQRVPWVATYLHFILTAFKKRSKATEAQPQAFR